MRQGHHFSCVRLHIYAGYWGVVRIALSDDGVGNAHSNLSRRLEGGRDGFDSEEDRLGPCLRHESNAQPTSDCLESPEIEQPLEDVELFGRSRLMLLGSTCGVASWRMLSLDSPVRTMGVRSARPMSIDQFCVTHETMHSVPALLAPFSVVVRAAVRATSSSTSRQSSPVCALHSA